MSKLSEPQRAALAAWALRTGATSAERLLINEVFPTKYSAPGSAISEEESFTNRYLARSMRTLEAAGMLDATPAGVLAGNPLLPKFQTNPARLRETLRRWVAALTRPDRPHNGTLISGPFALWLDRLQGPELFPAQTRNDVRGRWLAALDVLPEAELEKLQALREPVRSSQ